MPPSRGSRLASPIAPPLLPKASFRKVEGEEVNEPLGVNDPAARSYGYNDFSYFTRSRHYIRYIEPLENELNNQVEYDMDEQDQEWLDLVNEERKKAQVGAVSSEVFEILMDKLEKEWFEIMKRVPKADIGLPSEDSTCAICDDGEGENSNAIVFCDGCNLAVHQDCYGVPYIPEGQWLCRKCTVSPEVPVACVFCPNEGGAFKQTSTGLWAHLLCAMFIPEVTVGNMLFMEPIENIDKVPKSRWKLTCSLCKIKGGACIQCDKSSCFAAFHVTCARRAKLLMGMKGLSGEETAFKGYCERHLPEEVKKTRGETVDSFEGPLTIQSRTKSSKIARAYAKKYNIGPPLVPQIIVDKLENYYKKHFRQKNHFIHLVCKYWSLKREARRGAPLLKRLHLEPWSISPAIKQQSEEEKAMKLGYLLHLRANLERVRVLTELARQREELKLKQAQLFRGIVSNMIFPHSGALKQVLGQIQSLDKNDIFRLPVTRAEAPDYYDIIKNPMCFSAIEVKIDNGDYLDLESFKGDINLVFENAMLYNKRETVFHKSAARLKTASVSLLAPLSDLISSTSQGQEATEQNSYSAGNLEASDEVLQMLLSERSIMDDTDLVIGTDPITSLFRFELPKLKPPPPASPSPPPSPPKPKKEKPKRDYRAERERRKEIQAAQAAKTADAFSDFRAPRTTRSGKIVPTAAEAPMEVTKSKREVLTETMTSLPPYQATSLQPDISVELPMTESSEKPKSRSWKRNPLVLPGQGAPNMMESVDKQDSFKNFDRGWILPSGTRRRGPTVTELWDSPPRKRARTEHETSGFVVTSGPTTDATSQSAPPSAAESHAEAASDTMDIDQANGTYQEGTNVEDSKPDIGDRERSRSVPKQPSTIPEPRPSAMPEPGPSQDTTPVLRLKQPSRSHKKGASNSSMHPPRAKGQGPTRGKIVLKEGQGIPGGTLVWAKMESYPWWAAVVWEEDTKGIPPDVLKDKDSVQRTEPGPLTLVQFYDTSKSSWKWLELSSLRLLGEDKELDDELLLGRSKVQTFRTPRLKQMCRAAYRKASAEMEQPGDDYERSAEASLESSASTHSGRTNEAYNFLQSVRDTPQQASEGATVELTTVGKGPQSGMSSELSEPEFEN